MEDIQGAEERLCLQYDFERFLDAFAEATKSIGSDYFQLPVAGQEYPLYRERVYCYELYHQLRLAMTCSLFRHKYMLCGELDKSGHPLMRDNQLNRVKPDLLVHVPRSMTQNLVAIEVKPVARTVRDQNRPNTFTRRAIRRDEIKKDLENLTSFRCTACYRHAIYLIYGDDDGRFEHIRSTASALAGQLNKEEIKLSLIDLYYHRESGQSAKKIMWS